MVARFPWQSPYVAFDNKPIILTDPKGLAASGPKGTAPDEEDSGSQSSSGGIKSNNGSKVENPSPDAAPGRKPITNDKPGTGYSTSDGKMMKYNQNGVAEEAFFAKNMDVSQAAQNSIMKHEGIGDREKNIYDDNGNCILACPYDDMSDYATIGYGHLIEKAPYDHLKYSEWDNGIIVEEALELFMKDLESRAASTIRIQINIPLLQQEFDALVIAKYNGGYGSTLRNTVNMGEGNPTVIYKAFLLRSNSGGRRRNGLVARRASEAAIFLNNDFHPYPNSQFKNVRQYYQYWNSWLLNN